MQMSPPPSAEVRAARVLWPTQRTVDAEFEVLAIAAEDHLRVSVDGHPTMDQLLATLHVFGIESQSSSHALMLMDLRLLRTRFVRAELRRIGDEIASCFLHLSRFAMLVQADHVTGVAQRSAQRSGMNMRVFDRERAALDWLRSTA